LQEKDVDVCVHHSTIRHCWCNAVMEKQNAIAVLGTKAIYSELGEVLIAWEKISLGIPLAILVLHVQKR